MNSFNITPVNIGDLFLEARRNKDINTIQALQTAVQFEMEKRKAKKQRELASVLKKQLAESGVEIPAEMETPEEVLTASQIPLQRIKASAAAMNELKETVGNIKLAKTLGLIDDKAAESMLSIVRSGEGKIPSKTLGEVINTMLRKRAEQEKTRMMLGYWSSRQKEKFPISLLTQKMEMQPNPNADFLKRDLLKPIAISYSELLFTTPEFLANRYWEALGYKAEDYQQVLQKFKEARQIAIGSLVNSLKMAQPGKEEELLPLLQTMGENSEQSTQDEQTGASNIEDEVDEFERFLFGVEQ